MSFRLLMSPPRVPERHHALRVTHEYRETVNIATSRRLRRYPVAPTSQTRCPARRRRGELEGRDRARNVVARFPSLQAAVDCYHSAEYQAALDHARGASLRDLVVVEEVG